MKYLHILLACACEPWAMERGKLVAVTQFLMFKAQGGEFSAEEVRARISPSREQRVVEQPGQVAVLDMFGVISQRMNMFDEISGGTSTEVATKQIRALQSDEEVKAIILNFDSPGGTVYGIEELAAEILASRGGKPIIAQVNSACFSAAYWLASACEEIIVTPGGQAGSIGVYSIHEDISKMLEMEGIKETLIYAGKFKVEGNPYEPLGDAAAEEIQRRVDQVAASFVRDVAAGRGVGEDFVNDRFGQGRFFGAAELVKRKMADRVATLDDTLERLGVEPRPAIRRQNASRAAALDAGKQKIGAGDRLTLREWEGFFKGLGFSNSEAERAARVNFKEQAQGDPESGSAQVDERGAKIVEALQGLKGALDGFKLPTLTTR